MDHASRSPRRTPRRILIIKPSSLGDVVHALPVLDALRRAYPRAQIAWLVADTFAPLLDGHPLLDEVIRFDRRRYGHLWRSPRIALDFARFALALRHRHFDLVLDLQGLIRSGLFAWFTGAPRRIGFAHAREFAPLFYSRRVRCPAKESHAVTKNIALARAAGVAIDTPAFPLGLRSAERSAAQNLLAATAGERLRAFLAVLPGARWESKQWPPASHAALLDRLHAEGYPRAVLLGAPFDRPLADAILARTAAPAVDLVGRTSLRELAALLEAAALVICQDSGPMHVAAALGRPLVALFGPTNPRRTGPWTPMARIAALPLACSPCYRRHCPLGHHACMRELTVAQVMANVRELSPGSAEGNRGAAHAGAAFEKSRTS